MEYVLTVWVYWTSEPTLVEIITNTCWGSLNEIIAIAYAYGAEAIEIISCSMEV